MQDNSFWFYTLSAIPQTLAAMIALFATFVVYRLSYINNSIERDDKIARWFLSIVDEDEYTKSLIRGREINIATAFTLEAEKLQIRRDALDGKERIRDEFIPLIDSYGFFGRSSYNGDAKKILFIQDRAKILKNNVENKILLYSYLKKDIYITACAIIFPLVFLPLLPVIIKFFQPYSVYIIWAVIITAIILAVWSILYTAKRIWGISHL